MEEGRRSENLSGGLVKNRNSSGCLIIKKKSAGIGGGVELRKEKKRPRLILSPSESDDESEEKIPRRIRVDTSNGAVVYDGGKSVRESEIRKKNRLDVGTSNGAVVYDGGNSGRESEIRKKNRFDIGQNQRKLNRFGVFDFDDHDRSDLKNMRKEHWDDRKVEAGGLRLMGSKIHREFGSGSRSNIVGDKRKHSHLDDGSSLVAERNRGIEVKRDLTKHKSTSLPRFPSDEPIRLQGKNGVLKVMLKKKPSGSPKTFDQCDAEDKIKGSRSEDVVKRNMLVRPLNVEENRKGSRSEDVVKKITVTRPSPSSGKEVHGKPALFVKTEKNNSTPQKSLIIKNGNAQRQTEDSDKRLKLGPKAEDSDKRLKLGPKAVEAQSIRKWASNEEDRTPAAEKVPPPKSRAGKVRRGCGTEKQLLREQIRTMLVDAGWTIDFRPRRNRDYLDAVYTNPSGTAYWSIIKAYEALQKQLEEEDNKIKSSGDGFSFEPISNEVLSKLTRQTRQKMEKELKRKKREEDGVEFSNTRHDDRLSSFMRQGGKSLKGRVNENGFFGPRTQSSTYDLHEGRKRGKLGRCTLLVRSSKKGINSESDGYVPYTGKRTLLSWLIDCGTVRLSEKVQYMNRKCSRVMLEGWITRDGIHCACCSKILTVSKFEIHAGSKLRQPFQNIYLESGVSLLQCQLDAWNRQDEPERKGFHTVDVEGDDPNDDTCGICGDGGDLICCDGCPSTFHQSCLGIQALPPGDWHCPNCSCKFCGLAGETIAQGNNVTHCAFLKCSSCERKYHESCIQEMDDLSIDINNLTTFFCGQKCRELFENLQKHLGVKHELEGGFSWSLIHRTEVESDISTRGFPQKVEGNSKLAVALTVMDECFLPIIDRRSRINLIHNVLYNRGSNFNRLNYSGFYTAILERGDEIIAAASIRIHGTQLAEMPYIGTRHIYRRQGMCRRLFYAIQLTLLSLKVEKMIIPAIPEHVHTWTVVFGFTPLEESQKQELRSLNILVFPDISMLQKLLLEQDPPQGNGTDGSKASIDMNSSVGHEVNGKAISESPLVGASLNNDNVMSGSLDLSRELKPTCLTSRSGDKLSESTVLTPSDLTCSVTDTEIKSVLDAPVKDGQIKIEVTESTAETTRFSSDNKPVLDSFEGRVDDDKVTSKVATVEPVLDTPVVDREIKIEVTESSAETRVSPDGNCEVLENDNKPVLDSLEVGCVGDDKVTVKVATVALVCHTVGDISGSSAFEETNERKLQLGEKLADSATETPCLPPVASPESLEVSVQSSTVFNLNNFPEMKAIEPAEEKNDSATETGNGSMVIIVDNACEVKVNQSDKFTELASKKRRLSPSSEGINVPETGNELMVISVDNACEVKVNQSEKLTESAVETPCLSPSGACTHISETGKESMVISVVDNACEVEVNQSEKFAESASETRCLSPSSEGINVPETGNESMVIIVDNACEVEVNQSEKFAESASETRGLSPSEGIDVPETGNESMVISIDTGEVKVNHSEKLTESAVETLCLSPSAASFNVLEMGNESTEIIVDNACETKVNPSENLTVSAIETQCLSPSDVGINVAEVGNKPLLDSFEGSAQSSALDINVNPSEEKLTESAADVCEVDLNQSSEKKLIDSEGNIPCLPVVSVSDACEVNMKGSEEKFFNSVPEVNGELASIGGVVSAPNATEKVEEIKIADENVAM